MNIMKILLIEDGITECENYKKIFNKRADVKLVAMTNSSTEAIEYVKSYKPDGIILDLELNLGEGSGFEFIENISKLVLNPVPKIVVTTNVYSDSVYDFCHSKGIDFIFYKKQTNYSQNNVIDTLLLLNKYNKKEVEFLERDDKINIEYNISEIIDKELDLVGISNHLQGRKYLKDAILYIIQNDEEKTSVVQHLVKLYKKPSSSISRGMQNAIIHGWRITPIEDLTSNYTAIVNYETGLPTPTEFIYYYAEKIKKQI